MPAFKDLQLGMHMNNLEPKFDHEGNKPTDLKDGVAITVVMMIIVAGIIYYLSSI